MATDAKTIQAQIPPVLAALLDLVEKMHDKLADPREQAAAAHHCLVQLLQAVASLLGRAPRGLSLRQLLFWVMKSIPVKIHLEEGWGDTIRDVRDCSSELLDATCNYLGDRVAVARLRLKEAEWEKRFRDRAAKEMKATRAARAKDRRAAAGHPNFPQVGVFRWARTDYKFGAFQWLLLKALWAGKAVDTAEVMWSVYRSDVVASNKLTQLRHDTQDALDRHGLPFVIERDGKGHWQLRRKRGRA
jgi:hypothetical protein